MLRQSVEVTQTWNQNWSGKEAMEHTGSATMGGTEVSHCTFCNQAEINYQLRQVWPRPSSLPLQPCRLGWFSPFWEREHQTGER